MADLDLECDGADEPYKDIDIDALWTKVQRRPLTISRKKSVLLAPDFIKRLKGEETVNEGNDLTVTFKVNGVPKPILRWFKDDEEVTGHPRLSVEEVEDGSFRLTLHQVNKGDEAAYRCRAENDEGASSCCFFLTVKGKPKSSKKSGVGGKRTVSFPTMFSTIVEKVEEEEKAGHEAAIAGPSPVSRYYDSLTLTGRLTWPSFLGDWAFVNSALKARGGSAPPEDRPVAPLGREVRAKSESRTKASGKGMGARSSPVSQIPISWTALKPRTLCFFSKTPSSQPTESELYRRMLIAHRRKLRHVDRPDRH